MSSVLPTEATKLKPYTNAELTSKVQKLEEKQTNFQQQVKSLQSQIKKLQAQVMELSMNEKKG